MEPKVVGGSSVVITPHGDRRTVTHLFHCLIFTICCLFPTKPKKAEARWYNDDHWYKADVLDVFIKGRWWCHVVFDDDGVVQVCEPERVRQINTHEPWPRRPAKATTHVDEDGQNVFTLPGHHRWVSSFDPNDVLRMEQEEGKHAVRFKRGVSSISVERSQPSRLVESRWHEDGKWYFGYATKVRVQDDDFFFIEFQDGEEQICTSKDIREVDGEDTDDDDAQIPRKRRRQTQ